MPACLRLVVRLAMHLSRCASRCLLRVSLWGARPVARAQLCLRPLPTASKARPRRPHSHALGEQNIEPDAANVRPKPVLSGHSRWGAQGCACVHVGETSMDKLGKHGQRAIGMGCGGVFSKSQGPKALSQMWALIVEVRSTEQKRVISAMGQSIVDFARCPVWSMPPGASMSFSFYLQIGTAAASPLAIPNPHHPSSPITTPLDPLVIDDGHNFDKGEKPPWSRLEGLFPLAA